MTAEEICTCKKPEPGLFICWKCGKRIVPESVDKTIDAYAEYIRLCELYGEEVALRLVYG